MLKFSGFLWLLGLLVLLAGCRSITVAGKSTSDEAVIKYVEERCKKDKCGSEETKLVLNAYKNQSKALKLQTKRQTQLEERSFFAAMSTGRITQWLIWAICIVFVFFSVKFVMRLFIK